jgi:hypothetical protein
MSAARNLVERARRVAMRSTLVVIIAALLLLPGLASPQQPHDDLRLLISKFGPPDEIDSTENDKPRPPIVTKQLIYVKERVRAVYYPDGPVGSPPPYRKWKLLFFQDHRTDQPLRPAEALQRGRAQEHLQVVGGLRN